MNSLSEKHVIRLLARRLGVCEAEAERFCRAQAAVAAEIGEGGFAIPGIGQLLVRHGSRRTLTLMAGPDRGKTITVPPNERLVFRIAPEMKKQLIGAGTAEKRRSGWLE